MCGEKPDGNTKELQLLGSPPHVRGKAFARVPVASIAGITPACAGKRDGHFGVGMIDGDHPRMCGEKPVPR